MAEDEPKKPDLATGVPLDSIEEGELKSFRVGDEPVVLLKRDSSFLVVGGMCTHMGAPLADGLVTGDLLRCPWHHACFDMKSGEAVAAPAFDPLARYTVEIDGSRVFARAKMPAAEIAPEAPPADKAFVIVGGGAAGFAAADMLRRRRFKGAIVMLSDDDTPPYDRTRLSKEYLDGTTKKAELPLAQQGFEALDVDLRLGVCVTGIDAEAHAVFLEDGTRIDYAKLLLATGSAPRRAEFDGAASPHVHVLRSLADCDAIIADAGKHRRVVVLGSSFIGLEVAAALRQRGAEVEIVTDEKQPMARIFGGAVGDHVRQLHEKHGTRFHLGKKIVGFDGSVVTLDDGQTLAADVVVVGIGVTPRLELAEKAGLAIDKGIVVDRFMRTSAPDIYAAGDIARWQDIHTGLKIRVEHWVVAERHGQVAARNMLGHEIAYDDVPFFWTMQFDFVLHYHGHADEWDDIVVDGDLDHNDCTLRYRKGMRTLAVATVGRDMESLKEEVEMTRWHKAG